MLKRLTLMLLWPVLAGLAAPPPQKADQPAISLWRLDCGRIVEAQPKLLPSSSQDLAVGCYLIRHGDRHMLWDTGISDRALGNAHPTLKLDRSIVDQLKQIGVRPEQIEFVGISHYHGDHTGQASRFPKAKLIMGAADFNVMKGSKVPEGVAPTHLAPWIRGGAPVHALTEDLDVFGDARVTVLMAPGHTPGHLALLVKLASRPVLLSGDLWLGNAELMTEDMPDFSSSRAELAASRERFRRLVYKHDGMAVLQHELDDIDKLPPFPQFAR